jgi:hypothetical protein
MNPRLVKFKMGVPHPIFLTVYGPVLCVLLQVCIVELSHFQVAKIFHGFYKLLPCTMKNDGHANSEDKPYLEYAV